MITAWDVYWITRLDYIVGAAWFMFLLSVIVLAWVIVGRAFAMEDHTDFGIKREWRKAYRSVFIKYLSCALFSFVFFLLTITLTPDTKNACAIYLIPKIANNEQVQKIPDNFAKLLNAKMEEWIQDTITDEKEKK